MPRFRARPVEIDAVQWRGDNVDEVLNVLQPHWPEAIVVPAGENEMLHVITRGELLVHRDEYVVVNIDSVISRIPADVFAERYEPISGS